MSIHDRETHPSVLRRAAETRVWQLLQMMPSLPPSRASDPEELLAARTRREEARRKVDKLLR